MIKSISVVTIGPEVDYSMGLYVNDRLVVSGDEYHNDIQTMISGYILGVRDCGYSGKIQHYSLPSSDPYSENVLNLGRPLPENFSSLPVSRLNNEL